jgi:CMP-N,N'-diacetyllegionaminic acid synthase
VEAEKAGLLKVLGIIPARGASKGVPGKNIKPLGGIPLIAHTIRAAAEAACLDRVWVSTDDPETARISEEFGVSVPWLRPAELAQDDSRLEDALIHILRRLESDEGYHPDAVLILQPTSPFRRAETISRAVELFETRDRATIISVSHARHHPAWCYSIDADTGALHTFIGDVSRPLPRQELPDAFIIDGSIFLFSVETFLPEQSMYTDQTYPLMIPPEESIDIDTPYDWEIAEGLWAQRSSERLAQD